ncbi:MAG: hypothetical protein RL641_512 [Candidatus Parcubacteria bacterium]|jgi:uncharacterized membrane protein
MENTNLENTSPNIEPARNNFITKCFRTKRNSFATILILSAFIYFIAGLAIVTSMQSGGYGYMQSGVYGQSQFYPLLIVIFRTPLLLFLVALVLYIATRVSGYKEESKNILKATRIVLLTLIVLGVIGFGICLLAFNNF